MSKSLLKALPELLTAGVIDNDTASRIQNYYLKNKETPQNRLLIVFGVLGTILVGLG